MTDARRHFPTRFLLGLDVIALTGEAWGRRVGETSTVARYPMAREVDGHWRVYIDSGHYVASSDTHHYDFSAVLRQRGGKTVKHIIINNFGSVNIEFEDGTTTFTRYTDSTGSAGNAGLYTTERLLREDLAHEGWCFLVRNGDYIQEAGVTSLDGSSEEGIYPDSMPVNEEDIKALANDLDLCEDFDRAMFDAFGWSSRSHSTPTFGELRRIARDKGYLNSLDEKFPAAPPEPFVALTLPAEGSRVKITRHDGQTFEGVLTRVTDTARGQPEHGGPYRVVYIDGSNRGHVHTEATCKHSDVNTNIVSIEVLEKVWAVGDVVNTTQTVGKWWLYVSSTGTPMRVGPSDRPTQTATIAWIGDN